MSMIAFHWSSVSSSVSPPQTMPALLNIRSSRARAVDHVVDGGLHRGGVGDVETRRPCAREPSDDAVRSAASPSMSVQSTSARRRRPAHGTAPHRCPDPAPVTMACFPAGRSTTARQSHDVAHHVGVALEMSSAVDVEHLTGQPRRFRRAQEDNRIGDLLRRARPADRGVVHIVLDHPRYRGGRRGQWGVNEPGGHGVDPDAAWPHLQGGHLGQHRQTSLGRAVGAHSRRGLPGVERELIDTSEPPSRRCLPACFMTIIDPLRHTSTTARETLDGHVGDQADIAEPRTIHGDVESPVSKATRRLTIFSAVVLPPPEGPTAPRSVPPESPARARRARASWRPG